MAVFKLFPEKDATLYSLFPIMNTGLDQMIESTATAFSPSDPNPQVSRFLVQFNTNEMLDVANNIVGDNEGVDWKAYLKLSTAKSTGLRTNTTIDIHTAAKSWEMGTGLYLDSPMTTNGTSWIFTGASGSSNRWISSGDPFTDGLGEYTGSYVTSSVVAGGGVWYYNTTGSAEYNWSLSESITFNYRSDLDVNQDVTGIVYHWIGSGSIANVINNYGFIVKLSSGSEFQPTKDIQPELKYFSVDTSTIYPPVLEFRWDDFSWQTGSLSLLSTTSPYVEIAENPGEFNQGAKNRFRVYSRPEYPTRVWQTSSYYTTNYTLPEGSTYAVKDLDTNEYVINFDPSYTKISSDSTSNYFDIYMNGLEPERYYKILISSSIGGSEYVFDDKYYFKVING
jgi:hypothetical protein